MPATWSAPWCAASGPPAAAAAHRALRLGTCAAAPAAAPRRLPPRRTLQRWLPLHAPRLPAQPLPLPLAQVRIEGKDRNDLLMSLTGAFTSAGVVVVSASIQSEDGKVTDVFRVQDLEGKKVRRAALGGRAGGRAGAQA